MFRPPVAIRSQGLAGSTVIVEYQRLALCSITHPRSGRHFTAGALFRGGVVDQSQPERRHANHRNISVRYLPPSEVNVSDLLLRL